MLVENAASLYFQQYRHLLFPVSSSPPLPESPLNAEFMERKAIHPKKKGQHPCTNMNLPLPLSMFTLIKLKEPLQFDGSRFPENDLFYSSHHIWQFY